MPEFCRSFLLALVSVALVAALPVERHSNTSLVNASRLSGPGPVAGGAFVHLFEWSWKDVATECEEWLGPKGFNAVQVSPAMEHITGPNWWTRYQPVSYQLTSRSGDRADFAAMVQSCKKVGVAVYADTVFNHMAAGQGKGTAGTDYTARSFPPLYTPDDFHHNPNDNGANCAVTNFQDQQNVQECDLVGLPDLDTSSSKVQGTIGNYLKDLASLGVEGFRVDASKHQEAGQLGEVLKQGPGVYAFHEVIEGAGEAVTPAMYFGVGQVTEFDYSRQLCPNVKDDGKMGYLEGFGEKWGLMAREHAVVFIDNHDTQRGEAILTYKDGAVYTLANVFMLGHPYGYPKVMSSYAFTGHDQGPPSVPVHSGGSSVNCGSGGPWICEHREPMIAGMVGFRKHVGDAAIGNLAKRDDNDGIAFSRGDQGFVVINRGSDTWTATLATGLADAQYADILGTSQSSITVSGGKASFSVPPMTAMALTTASKL